MCVHARMQEWAMEAQSSQYEDQVCCVCVQGCVLCFLYMSLHAALITGCPEFLSLSPLFLCASAVLSLVAVSFCTPVCVWLVPYL